MDERSDKVIEETVDQIVKLFSPSRVIEYNTKYDMDGKLRSFKLCIVGKIQDKKKMLTQIFDEVDSEIPYDILLYTEGQQRCFCVPCKSEGQAALWEIEAECTTERTAAGITIGWNIPVRI